MNKDIDNTSADFKGLTFAEAEQSRMKHGENRITPVKRASLWSLYAEKYKDPIIRILIAAAAISLILAFIEGDFMETIGIFIAIFLATTIGFYFETDATRKFNVLTALGEESPVKVIRDGKVTTIARKDVVVDDIVLIETGDEVPADGIIVKAVSLDINESSLTGEPIAHKSVTPGDGSKEAAYPSNMVLRGTLVIGGRGTYRVSKVGDATEIGRLSLSSTEITSVKTPLNIQLEKLARLISKFGLALSVAAFVLFLGHDIFTDDVWRGTDYFRMAQTVMKYFMMSVTLIVMSVPEGLPMAVTLSLALNMRRMLKNNNLVRKLHACETMGAVTVICTDKTGTLTENRMKLTEIRGNGLHIGSGTDGDKQKMDLLARAMAVNTTAETDDGKGIGNPTETALLIWTDSMGYDYKTIRKDCPIISQMPFSTERKYMATLAETPAGRMLFVKGAPEIVTGFCDMDTEEKEQVDKQLRTWQNQAMRTLAFACREIPKDHTGDIKDCLHGMSLHAVTAITDPIRRDVPEAVGKCRDAGIEVKIVTGDTSATAAEIARLIGINVNDNNEGSLITGAEFAALTDEEAYRCVEKLKVMSRARPADKQRLVEILQKRGEVVAVTGDGTNDAPALNHAHVGLSLGSGTSVAKEASDMTLLDDSFNSIVTAVMWGRSLYKNLQRFLFFQLVVNVTALLIVLGGSLIGTEMPLTVTQILWVNIIMDTFAAMALASLPPEEAVMKEKPRSRDEFIISRKMFGTVLTIGSLFFIVMFAILIWCLQSDREMQLHELTIFFTTFVMLQFWNLFNAKTLGTCTSALRGLRRDHGLNLVLLLILGGQWLIVTFGGEMFRTEPLSLTEWAVIVLSTSSVLWIGEILRWRSRRKRLGTKG
ncbi:calcium-translocating P-type ATPase, PMCA-type [Prevotella sp. PCHR]|uniref:P-type Ca(2+) transporter n=1 Tax=Xylanibacter caecicola TaxID=2736294 RepID=A0ABX2B305_9BACT|nr:calcium-translocating P-type ATPase, PMCA-type [Xylanibacter caecicola]NPE24469.1 calcium-translocating P-type ATPase, PMCA-type [Xylanibacter caecicola]